MLLLRYEWRLCHVLTFKRRTFETLVAQVYLNARYCSVSSSQSASTSGV
jgi:hypothetical protein